MPNPVRFYLCSDREDMRAEREYLHERVFPKLYDFARALGIEFEIVDPHRESEFTLAESFAAIDRCRPYFVALVGSRAGDRLDNIDDALAKSIPWLAEHAGGIGRLHAELRHGILNLPNRKIHLIYARDPKFLDDLPENARRRHLPATPAEAAERDEFLRRLRDWFRSDVRNYSCAWNPERSAVEGLESLGEMVASDLRARIENQNRPPTMSFSRTRSSAPAPSAPEPPALASAPLPALSAPPMFREDLMAEMELIKTEFSEEQRQALENPAAFSRSGAAAPTPPSKPVRVDENVQFTVYRPKVAQPEKWHPLLAFAHLSEKPLDAPADEPDPVEEVRRQAVGILGKTIAGFQSSTQDSLQAVPRRGEITFLPEVKGLEFNPPRRTFVWQESVHREEFRFLVDRSLDGTTARGKLSIFHGAILLGDVALAIKIDSTPPAPKIRSLLDAGEPSDLEAVGATRYRKIFASYSHKDLAIVEQFEAYAEALGDEYLRDWKQLRAGEHWQDKLMKMIREADVFQLFWSKNSMLSPFVRQEWEYALSLGDKGPSFVRPTYWEVPMPTSEAPPLPPPDLAELHFQRLSVPAKPKALSPSEAEIDLPRAAPNETATAIDIALPADSGVSLQGSVNKTEMELSLDTDSDDFQLQLEANSSADSVTVDADADLPAVPQDMFAAATESDFDLSADADAGSLADALDDDEATLDESSEMMVVDSDEPLMEGVDLSVRTSAPKASVQEEYNDDYEVPVRASRSEKQTSARASGGSSEALKIVVGVVILCAILFGLLVAVTGRIPFLK